MDIYGTKKKLTSAVFRRIACLIIALTVLCSDAGVLIRPASESIEEYKNTISGFTVESFWKNTGTDDDQSYIWNAETAENRSPRLVLMYNNPNLAFPIYNEDIVFTVPCFGDAARDKTIEPLHSSDSAWVGNYDKNTNEYTYTYHGGELLSGSLAGGFELVWNLAARDCENGFDVSRSVTVKVRQRDENGNVILDESGNEKWENITLPPLNYSFTSVRDNYIVDVENDEIGFISSDEYSENDKAYYWYNINSKITRTEINARGLEMSSYYLEITPPETLPEGADLSKVYLRYKDTYYTLAELYDSETGTYRLDIPDFQNVKGDFDEKKITVNFGIPTGSAFGGVNFDITGHFDRLYKDDTEWVSETIDGKAQNVDNAEDKSKISVSTEVEKDYTDTVITPGKNTFTASHSKSNTYSKENNKLNSLELINGRTIGFTLNGKVTTAVENYSLTFEDGDLGGDLDIQITDENGNLRTLSPDEYDIVSVTMPSYRKYNIASSNGDFTKYNYTITAGGKTIEGDTTDDRTISLGASDSLKIEIKDISGNIDYSPVVRIYFHLAEDTFSQTGKIVNHSKMTANYKDAENAAQEIVKTAETPVLLREPQVSLTSSTGFAAFSDASSDLAFASTVTTGGTITADVDTSITKFTLYTIIPSSLAVDINSDISVNGKWFKASEGDEGKQQTNFTGRYELSTRKDGGNTIIAADFYFDNEPVLIGSNKPLNVSIKYPVTLPFTVFTEDPNRSYEVYSYTMLHNSVKNLSANSTDSRDLDLDGNTEEKAARSYASRAVTEAASAWVEYAPKYVKSAYSDGYVKETHVKITEIGDTAEEAKLSEYSYRLDLQMGNYNTKELVFYDNLENAKDKDDKTTPLSEWQGVFQGIDITGTNSNFDSLGLYVKKIYYSEQTDAEYDITKTDVWQEYNDETTDKNKVKSIAVVVAPIDENKVIPYSTYLFFTVKMKAPENTNLLEKTAVNDFHVIYDGLDRSGNVAKENVVVDSDVAKVKLTTRTVKLTIQKTDHDNLLKTYYKENGDVDYRHYSPIAGAVFEFKNTENNKIYSYTANSRGVIVIDDLQYGTYTVTETKPPRGYEAVEPFTLTVGSSVTVSGDDIKTITDAGGVRKNAGESTAEVQAFELEIPDPRMRGEAKLIKYSENQLRGEYKIKSAQYELYTGNDELVSTTDGNVYSVDGAKQAFTTGEDGSFTITELPWGTYYFLEKKAPEGYQTSSQKQYFTVGYDTVADEECNKVVIEVRAQDLEENTQLILVKKDEVSGSNLKGAQFMLEMFDEKNSKWITGDSYITATGGQILIEGLCFGKYRFKEINPPEGYVKPEGDVYFPDENGIVLGPDETDGKVYLKQTVTAKNERRPACVKLRKESEEDGRLPGATYALYKVVGEPDEAVVKEGYPTVMKPKEGDEDDVKVKRVTTGADGETDVIKDLEWGDYYFLEEAAPQGYVLNTQPTQVFTLGAGSTNVDVPNIITTSDERALGTVQLKKVAKENQNTVLPGAKFDLYRNDGTVAKSGLVTDADGIILVEDLEWGVYYFEEVEAPVGYGLNPDKIRFAVTKANCQSVQQLVCEDPVKKAQLTIEKEIDARLDAYGSPTFIFKVEKLNGENVEKSWTKMITLSSGLSGSTVLSGLEPGTYRITEQPVSRYSLKSATAVDPLTDSDTAVNSVTVTLEAAENGAVKFVNELKRYDKYSHSTSAVNVVSTGKKLTSISAELLTKIYEPADDTAYVLSGSDFAVTAVYDDGSEKTLSIGSFTDSPWLDGYYYLTVDGNPANLWQVSGKSTVQYIPIKITFTEGGITCTADVIMTVDKINQPDPFTVTFDANGGRFDNGESTKGVTYRYDAASGKMVPEEDVENIIPKNSDTTKSFGGWYYDNGENGTFENPVDFTTLAQTQKTDVTVYAKWNVGRAKLNSGSEIAKTFNTLSGDKTQITAIKYSQIAPTEEQMSNKISINNSEIEVYAWYDSDNTTIYWWSEDKSPLVNSNMSNTFSSFSNLKDISGLMNWDTSAVTAMNGLFQSCSNLENVSALKKWDTSKVTTMEYMFKACSTLSDITGLENWDTSKVTTMNQMFLNCYELNETVPLSNWETGSVTNMNSMFSSCKKLSNLSGLNNWDTSNVTNMNSMFKNCSGLTDISALEWGSKTSKVTNMQSMFEGCENIIFITSLGGWDTGNVTNMNYMLKNCKKITDLTVIDGWDVNNVNGFTNFASNVNSTAITDFNANKTDSDGNLYTGFKTRSGTIGSGGTYYPGVYS
ncbi:MAG: SpaA isopeptide-forming pilin-related protein [Oscillospiraceae bacterium]